MTDRVARKIVLSLLRHIEVGRLTVVEGGRRTTFGRGAPEATVCVQDPRAWTALLRGSRGLAESYRDGLWETPDLTAVIRVAARRSGATRRSARARTSRRTTTSATSSSGSSSTPP